MEHYEIRGNKAQITVSKKIKEVHPVVVNILNNLAKIDLIKFIKIFPDFLQASSEITNIHSKIPITKPGHPTAIGISLLIDFVYKNIQFYEITSAIKGYGGKMVDAVLDDLPKDWKGVVIMDWSDGFWDKMEKKHKNLMLL